MGSGIQLPLTAWTLNARDRTPSVTLAGTIPAGGVFFLERSDARQVYVAMPARIARSMLGFVPQPGLRYVTDLSRCTRPYPGSDGTSCQPAPERTASIASW
jgi:hypothetical protein